MIERFDPETLVKPAGYTHVAIAPKGSRTVYVAGQTGCDKEGVVVAKGDHQAQTEQAMTNIRLALEAVGASPEQIVKMTIYAVNFESELYRPIMLGFKAAREHGAWAKMPMVLIGVSALGDPDALIEVDAIAEID